MFLRKGTIIFSLLVCVVCFSTLTAGPAGDQVDVIYNNIRNQGPLYQWEAQDLNFQNEGMNLVCTLTTPKVTNQRPIILILHGFGGDRVGFPVEGTGEGYFERLARVLAEQGFSSLRVDFRGSGESDGEYEITTFSGQVSDGVAALDFIQTLGRPVNQGRIGVVGHSQGGLVGSLLSAQDKRVKSLTLWAAPSAPSHDYEGLLLVNGMKQGLALPDGGTITLGLYVEGVYIFDMTLGKQFFVELFTTDPLLPVRDFRRPLMYVSPLRDNIVWPQPIVGENFLRSHEGYEKLVTVDAGHNFNYLVGPDQLDDTIYWTIAWFIKTL
ncbi:MAG: alpha/beta hydrolase [bacterium]|nr:alpha/beta hydrolase [bacterium]